MTATEERINAMFADLVPVSGKADTVAGEIVRAICRIGYRNFNDGDHIGVGYGRETCNPAARFLSAKGNDRMEAAIEKAWGVVDDDLYDEHLTELEEATLDYLERHSELARTENTEDMWDYRDDIEDVDSYDEDEEDEEDEYYGAMDEEAEHDEEDKDYE